MRLPPPLAPGARVALVAPAGPLRGPDELERSLANARALGWEPTAGEHVLARHDYLGGSDSERLRDLNAALADESVDAIWCVRGGYGAMRLLPRLDYASLTRRPRVLLGYSDVTALHAAILRGDLPDAYSVKMRSTTLAFSGSISRSPGLPSTAR